MTVTKPANSMTNKNFKYCVQSGRKFIIHSKNMATEVRETPPRVDVLMQEIKEKMSEVEKLYCDAAQKLYDSARYEQALDTWIALSSLIHDSDKYQSQMSQCRMLLYCMVDGVLDKRRQASWFVMRNDPKKAAELLAEFQDDDSLVDLALCQIALGRADISKPLLKESQDFIEGIQRAVEKKDRELFTDIVFEFDQVKRIENDRASLLLGIKHSMPREDKAAALKAQEAIYFPDLKR